MFSSAWGGSAFDFLQPGSRPDVGLGGDPFLSHLEDRTGWWSEIHPWQGVEVQALSNVPVSSKATNGHGSLNASQIACSITRRVHINSRLIFCQGRITTPQWEGTWNREGGSLTLGGEATRVELGLRVMNLVHGLTLQFTAPLWEMARTGRTSVFGAGVRCQAVSWLALQGRIGHRSWREPLDSRLYGETLEASLNLSALTQCYDVRLVLPWRVELEGTHMRANYNETAALDTKLLYHISPMGHSTLDQLGISWRFAWKYRVLLRFTQGGLDAAASGYWGGQRFARLNYAQGGLRSWLVGLQRPFGARGRFLIEGESAKIHGRLRGHIETWPFTSTVIDLLGIRRVGKAELEMRWYRAHAAMESGLGRHLQSRFGLGWYDLWPEAELVSWRPAFLAFGSADRRRDEIQVPRLQLASISLGATLRRGDLRCSLELEQFIPVRTFRRAEHLASQEPTSQGTDPNPDHNGLRRTWPSGTSLKLTISHSI